MISGPVVYRIYDADSRLIYIGATKNLKQRLENHRSVSWWNSLTARVEVESYPDVKSALTAEAAAISTERPAFNLTHTGSYTVPPRMTETDVEVCREWVAQSPACRFARAPRFLRHRLRDLSAFHAA